MKVYNPYAEGNKGFLFLCSYQPSGLIKREGKDV